MSVSGVAESAVALIGSELYLQVDVPNGTGAVEVDWAIASALITQEPATTRVRHSHCVRCHRHKP